MVRDTTTATSATIPSTLGPVHPAMTLDPAAAVATRRLELERRGAGWGDPRQRDPALVARDVRLGFISDETAARDYGVAVTGEGRVDEAGTAALRKGAAA